MRERLKTAHGVTVSYSSYGSGPPLVLVHGGFSDDESNWEFVSRALGSQFAVRAIARRGRGETDATTGHSVEDEARDIAALIESAGEPVFLLGHSYGAQCSLAAAALVPDRIRKLVLYEPPWPHILREPRAMTKLEEFAAAGDWDGMSFSFFKDVIHVPLKELEEVRGSDLWPPIVRDAKATLGDLQAIQRYDFQPERFRNLKFPVLLQIGSESPRDFWATDALAAVLPNATIEVLQGQAHEGMTTAPDQYAASLKTFLL